MTHLHVDHTSGMRLLPKATFICAEQEWAAAQGRFAAAHGYVHHHLPAESRVELLDFDRQREPYGAFAKTIDLAGDGSIRLVFTPGHTHGHQSVLLRLGDGHSVLVVGDAAYTSQSIHGDPADGHGQRPQVTGVVAGAEGICLSASRGDPRAHARSRGLAGARPAHGAVRHGLSFPRLER
jgi:glyoxylase-like metal-dependent hydrolase (beta-lactamase superfamily II)